MPSAEPIDEVLPLSTPAHLCGEKVSDRPQTANGQGEEGRAEKAASGKGKLPGKGQGKGSKSKGLAGGEWCDDWREEHTIYTVVLDHGITLGMYDRDR